MRIPLIALLAAGLVTFTGCPAADDDRDDLETVPEAPTRPPIEHDVPQVDEDPLAPDAGAGDTLPGPDDSEPRDDEG